MATTVFDSALFRDMFAILCENSEIVSRLGEQRIRELTDPANYLGAAERMALAIVEDTEPE
jgi:3-carboxy-cis,cis-muconate cycloisomerase